MRAYKLITAFGSPASNKVRAYLRWRDLPFRETAATALVLKSEVRPRLKNVKVPVLITASHETLQDSRLIFDWVEKHEPGEPLSPAYGHHRFAMGLIEAFGDEVLAPAAVHHFWSGNLSAAAGGLGAMVYPDLEPQLQRRYARILCGQLMNTLEQRGYSARTAGRTSALLKRTVAALEAHFQSSRFLLEDRPCSADFSLFGALSLLRELLDGSDRTLPDSPNVRRWMADVNAPWDQMGGRYRKAYAVPESLAAVCEVAAGAFLPEALETCAAVTEWAECNPGRINLPARLGKRKIPADEGETVQQLRPSTQWVFQRVIAPLHEDLPDAQRRAGEELLGAIGFERLAEFRPEREVLHEHHEFTVNLRAALPSREESEASREVTGALLKAREGAEATRDLDRMILG